jgi:hypothetical protein
MTIEFDHARTVSCPVPSRSAPFGLPARELTEAERDRLVLVLVAIAGGTFGLLATLGIAWLMAH